MPEIRESESKARSQAEMLKNALDEHGLELRVRAANEAEAACKQRLSAAEAEKEELRAQLDETERFVFVHTTILIWICCIDKLVENIYYISSFFSFIFCGFLFGSEFSGDD